MLNKLAAVESLSNEMGNRGLLLPAWINAALAANDRLKCALSVFQAGVQHARGETIDLTRERRAAGLNDAWVDEMLAGAAPSQRAGEAATFLPELPVALHQIADDLTTMARPVIEGAARPADVQGFIDRLASWTTWLRQDRDELLTRDDLARLESGHRERGDSVHLLLMDLHKQINQLAASIAHEDIDGAHAWALEGGPDGADAQRVRAFMRGLNRTAPLKFGHPGLDTAATRSGPRLLIQNDIGTNDAHVLVFQIEGHTVTLTYSDLHSVRFTFFQQLLAAWSPQWSVVEPRVSEGLNDGHAYFVGTATFACTDEAQLLQTLEGIGSRVVFLIDWNRARKRLQMFLDKPAALAVLAEAARRDVGHMGWLLAGAEHFLFGVMQSAGDGAFRLGDRLADVLGAEQAQAFVLETMALCARGALAGHPVSLLEDEARMLLSRRLQQHAPGFSLVAEHAAYCHELVQAVRDALSHDASLGHASELAARTKAWERRADHLVMQARNLAKRQPSWKPFANLVEEADEVADHLEEASFLISVMAEDHQGALHHGVRSHLSRLLDVVLQAVQDYVRALEIARGLGSARELEDFNTFLDATWRVVLAERRCDEQWRTARRHLLQALKEPAELMLANDLGIEIESASDALLRVSYALREMVLLRGGALAGATS